MSCAPILIRIVADDRERAGGVIEVLRSREDVALTVQRLEVGDFRVEENFVAERKTLEDFAASVIDGRWFRQVAAMAAGARRGLVILEGEATTAGSLGVSREALQGAQITASVFYGLADPANSRCQGDCATARVSGQQAQQSARGALLRPGYRPKGKRARQLYVLQGLPGIGPARAERLLQHFGSVEGVAKASADELAVIDGIGDRTAAKLRWIMEEPPGRYET
ncbi:MAG: nuclease [Verrucomicrobia bacterium]|nr:nuclease [Verrucomicrobiota bacterium]